MNLETFVVKCQEHINGEFDRLKCGDDFVETDRGKLRIEYSMYGEKHVDKVTFNAPGIELNMRPLRGAGGVIDYDHVLMHLAFAIITRYEARKKEILRIEELVAQLETIRKAEVFYKWEHNLRPRVDVILEGTEIVLFSVFGSGIKYQPSRTALGGLFRHVKHELTTQDVQEIAAVPITEYSKISERRCGRRCMDMFVSENVRYERGDEEDLGWIVIGDPDRICPIKRIRPEKILCDLTQAIDQHPDFADLDMFVFGNVRAEVHKTEPLKGLIESAGVTLHSKTNKDFKVWFRVYDNARVTCTCSLNDDSRKAVQIIEDYMRPLQLAE